MFETSLGLIDNTHVTLTDAVSGSRVSCSLILDNQTINDSCILFFFISVPTKMTIFVTSDSD